MIFSFGPGDEPAYHATRILGVSKLSAVTEKPDLPQCLSDDLCRQGLDGSGEGDFEYVAAHAYCQSLATHHYENFHVGTWLLPAEVREHAYNVYAYCRWSDDLADEATSPEHSLSLLGWWHDKLDRLYESGETDHVVFAALAHTIKTFDIPKKPLADLLSAFIQDQTRFRYESYDELLDYCTRSADPVGRLVLQLMGYTDEERRALSDKTCTALQLANFWQDVENDLVRGRIYLPLEDMRRFGVNEEDLAMPRATKEVTALIQFQVDRARALFKKGLPLRDQVSGRARFDIDLFSRGGLAILRAIEKQGCDVLWRRPKVGKLAKMSLLLQAILRGLVSRGKS